MFQIHYLSISSQLDNGIVVHYNLIPDYTKYKIVKKIKFESSPSPFSRFGGYTQGHLEFIVYYCRQGRETEEPSLFSSLGESQLVIDVRFHLFLLILHVSASQS